MKILDITLEILKNVAKGELTPEEANKKIEGLFGVSVNFTDGVEDGFGRECFYKGREVERYERGFPIFKISTYNGFIREIEAKFKNKNS